MHSHMASGFASELTKTAGPILARLVSLSRHPKDKKARSALAKKILAGSEKYVQKPIAKALRKSKLPSALGGATRVLTKDVPGTPRAVMKKRTLAQRKELGKKVGDKFVDIYSKNPELLLTLPAPVPGLTEGYLGTKYLARKALGIKKK